MLLSELNHCRSWQFLNSNRNKDITGFESAKPELEIMKYLMMKTGLNCGYEIEGTNRHKLEKRVKFIQSNVNGGRCHNCQFEAT